MTASAARRPGSSGGVFISYRREDASPYARMISDVLADRFGAGRVFRDVDTLAPGVDFPTAIADALDRCDALLALIGSRWLTAERHGRRRLDDPGDYVRQEIAAALGRDTLVVPVLIEDTPMPGRDELPPALAELADRNALRLADHSFDHGVRRLVDALAAALGGVAQAEPARAPAGPGTTRILASIGGPVAGQVAVGGDIVQHQSVAGPAAGPIEDERAELEAALAHLRERIRSVAAGRSAASALDRVDDLEAAVLDVPPDAATIEHLEGWFAAKVPAVTDDVARVTRLGWNDR